MTAFVNSFTDTIAGTNATTTVQFMLSKVKDPSLLSVEYELVDGDGLLYSKGYGGHVEARAAKEGVEVRSEVVIPIPSDIPANPQGTSYQVKITLRHAGREKPRREQFSMIKIISEMSGDEVGPEDTVTTIGQDLVLSIVLPVQPTDIVCLLFDGNNLPDLPSTSLMIGPEQVADGYKYTFEIPTAGESLRASLDAYTVIWQYVYPDGSRHEEVASAFLINASMAQAAKEINLKINKARAQVKDRGALQFTMPDLIQFLRRGRDQFNGYGTPSNMTMVNAKFAQREYWLQFSEVEALRSEYLAQAVTDFNFGGQAISLDVQHAQAYEALASQIEGRLYEVVRPYKDTLANRGLLNGDGSANPNSPNPSAIGTIGVSLSPIAPYSRNFSTYAFLGQRMLW